MLISSKSINAIARKLESASSGSEIFCSGLFLSARWFAVSQLDYDGVQVIVLPDRETAEYCSVDLYNLMEGDCVFFLPDSGRRLEKSNYKASLGVQRTSAIGKIIDYKEGKLVIVTYPSAFAEGVPTASKIRESLLKFSVGDEISHDDIVEALFNNGFERVDFVSEPGQFAVRGAIVDIFSYSYNDPFRISFFGDEIETINIFDCNTQLSKEKVVSAEIYPDLAGGDEESETLVQIADILPSSSLIWLDSSDMYKDQAFYPLLDRFTRIYMELPLSRQGEDAVRFNIAPQPVFNKNFELLTEDIRKRLEEGYRVRIYGEKQSQLDRLKSILMQNSGIMPEFIPHCNIHNGFIDHDDKVCCYSDHEIFDRFHRVSLRRTVEKSEQLTINDLTSFSIGDYIVHIDYGVGIFGGLVRMKDDKERMHEVVKLVYKDNDVVFVSVHALHKISRYKSKDSEPPKIHKIGSKVWQSLKASTKSKVKDIAKDLIQLYAKRKSSKGFAFSADTYLQQELESSFMYEDTPDQEKAVQAVKRDMEDDCPMDRLVCGDVGFGKTEVAVRAAFKAVADSKQVAVLVPTTILAWQHYQTFLQRMDGFPITVELLSRFKKPKEQAEIMRKLQRGETDIVIGTHKLLSKDLKFRDLGLLIVDEEQRFGVSQKEKLKELAKNVDVLTLTATPIPRTLNMAMNGISDISILDEAPEDRRPVQTYVLEHDDGIIYDAIRRELARGGQVLYLYNKIESIDIIASRLMHDMPDARVAVAHGKMEKDELEDIWQMLVRGEVDILVCTTIIETGVDIPNANTLIIEDADRMGLSQLHQLRGRVGRSTRRASAYCTFRKNKQLSEIAERRLSAIREYTQFGSGFQIAMRDLEIRGAGNLLGAKQHGHLESVGYDMYMQLLSEAIEILKNGEENYTPKVACQVDIQIDAFIPESYISSYPQRIAIYKRIADIHTDEDASDVLDELIDRYGEPPKCVLGLIKVSLLRNFASDSNIYEITQKGNSLLLYVKEIDKDILARLSVMKGRVMANASTRPYYSVRLKDHSSPVSTLEEIINYRKYR